MIARWLVMHVGILTRLFVLLDSRNRKNRSRSRTSPATVASLALCMQRVDYMVVPELGELITGPRATVLWDVLSGMLQGPSEVDFIRSVIGDDAVTMNSSAAEELNALVEILCDLRTPTKPSDVPPHSPAKVPLSSANKELLQERLRQLISSARVSPDDILKTPREKTIVDLVTRPPSSVGSCRSRSIDSRPTSVGSSSSRNTFCDPTKGLAPLRGSLRFDKVHEVKDRICDCFKAEYAQILQDIEFVRELIDVEVRDREDDVHEEPSVSELKTLTKKFEDAETQRQHVEMIHGLPVAKKRGSLASLPVKQL